MIRKKIIKPTLIKYIREEVGLSNVEANLFIISLVHTIMESVSNGEEVKINGFGTFGIRKRYYVYSQYDKMPSSHPIFWPDKMLSDEIREAFYNGEYVDKDLTYEEWERDNYT